MQFTNAVAAPQGTTVAIGTFTTSAVPEPATWLMLAAGLGLLAHPRIRRISLVGLKPSDS